MPYKDPEQQREFKRRWYAQRRDAGMPKATREERHRAAMRKWANRNQPRKTEYMRQWRAAKKVALAAEKRLASKRAWDARHREQKRLYMKAYSQRLRDERRGIVTDVTLPPIAFPNENARVLPIKKFMPNDGTIHVTDHDFAAIPVPGNPAEWHVVSGYTRLDNDERIIIRKFRDLPVDESLKVKGRRMHMRRYVASAEFRAKQLVNELTSKFVDLGILLPLWTVGFSLDRTATIKALDQDR